MMLLAHLLLNVKYLSEIGYVTRKKYIHICTNFIHQYSRDRKKWYLTSIAGGEELKERGMT